MKLDIFTGGADVILGKQLSTSGGRGGFLLFKLFRGVADNLDRENGEIKVLKEVAINGGAISSWCETETAAVDSRGANDGSKGF